MKLSDQLRRKASSLSKWGTVGVGIMRRAADELDKRQAQIDRLEKAKKQTEMDFR